MNKNFNYFRGLILKNLIESENYDPSRPKHVCWEKLTPIGFFKVTSS